MRLFWTRPVGGGGLKTARNLLLPKVPPIFVKIVIVHTLAVIVQLRVIWSENQQAKRYSVPTMFQPCT